MEKRFTDRHGSVEVRADVLSLGEVGPVSALIPELGRNQPRGPQEIKRFTDVDNLPMAGRTEDGNLVDWIFIQDGVGLVQETIAGPNVANSSPNYRTAKWLEADTEILFRVAISRGGMCGDIEERSSPVEGSGDVLERSTRREGFGEVDDAVGVRQGKALEGLEVVVTVWGDVVEVVGEVGVVDVSRGLESAHPFDTTNQLVGIVWKDALLAVACNRVMEGRTGVPWPALT